MPNTSPNITCCLRFCGAFIFDVIIMSNMEEPWAEITQSWMTASQMFQKCMCCGSAAAAINKVMFYSPCSYGKTAEKLRSGAIWGATKAAWMNHPSLNSLFLLMQLWQFLSLSGCDAPFLNMIGCCWSPDSHSWLVGSMYSTLIQKLLLMSGRLP